MHLEEWGSLQAVTWIPTFIGDGKIITASCCSQLKTSCNLGYDPVVCSLSFFSARSFGKTIFRER